MRRIRAFGVLLTCFLFLFPVSSYAAGTTTYDLDELGLSVDIPDSFWVFTRGTPADDPGYAEYGISKADMDSILEEKDIYLNALSSELNCEIVVTKIGSILDDFSTWSDVALLTMTDGMKDVYSEAGVTYIKSEIYNHPQAKFIKIYISQKSGDIKQYSVQYYTVYNSQAINITLHSYAGELGQEREDIVKEIVDSADFWDAEPVEVFTEPFEYVYPETGLRFTVPAGWEEEPLSKERKTIVAKFSSLKEGGLCILYGCADYWEELSPSDRIGYTRADLDNSILNEENVSAFAAGENMEATDVSKVTYGGREYYKLSAVTNTSAYGLDLSLPMTSMLRVEDGYLFFFQFGGPEGGSGYDDFEALLDSVSYRSLSASSGADLFSGQETGPSMEMILCILLAVVVIVLLARFLMSRQKGAKGEEAAKPSQSVPPAAPAGEEPTLFCRKCGTRLPQGSAYCHHCGAKTDWDGEK